LNGASIGTETITLTDQQQASWGGATVIALSGGAWDSASTDWEYVIDVNQTTSSSVFFEAYDDTTQHTDRGIEFRNVSGQTYLFCGTDDNNFQPVSLSTTTHSSRSDNHPIYLNDTVTLWSKHTPPVELGSFTVTSTLLYSIPPPPTPTFDIALTNDDLTITATLTNIVNPDPYYELMIHDANDTHLVGHTFATGDTTVVLTWTETSYGEKTYTKLLNGASIGTETTFIAVNAITFTGGSWNGVSYEYRITSGTKLVYAWYRNDTGYLDNRAIVYDYSINTWADAVDIPEYGGNIPDVVSIDNDTITLSRSSDGTTLGVFTDPYYEPPTIVSPLPALTEYMQSFAMEYYQTVDTKYYYKSDSHTGTGTAITYDYETKTWADEGSSVPYNLCATSTFVNGTTSLVNPVEIYGFGRPEQVNSGDPPLYFAVSNPYYEAN
jgi:hypothetical protein